MSRIVVAASDAGFEDRVRRALGGEFQNGGLRSWTDRVDGDQIDQAARDLVDASVEVVAVGPGLDLQTSMALAQAVDANHPEVSVVLVAQPSRELLEAALRAGVRDVVAPDAADPALKETFERALDSASRRRQRIRPDAAEPPSGGRLITVVSPKGGAGKTTVATNLAVGLAMGAPRDVVLVDLDLQFGDVANALRIVPEHGVVDAARAGEGLDATLLKVFLASHPSGIYALCGPDSPIEAEDVNAASVTRILEILTHEFSYVVVDTGSGLDDWALAAADQATDFVMVCATDVPTVRGVCKELEAFELLGMGDRNVHLLLNRADARVGLARSDIEATVGRPVDVSIPSSRSVPLHMNQGSAVLELDEPSAARRALLDLAGRFVELPADATRTRSIWPWRRTDR